MDTAAQCNGPGIDQVMQAAERRRVLIAAARTADCETLDDIYGKLSDVDAFTDARTLADFALSILPKGKRPVAMEQPEQCCARRSMFDEDANRISAWGFDIDDGEVFRANCHCLSCWTKGTFRVQFYRTEEEALLARRWHHLTT